MGSCLFVLLALCPSVCTCVSTTFFSSACLRCCLSVLLSHKLILYVLFYTDAPFLSLFVSFSVFYCVWYSYTRCISHTHMFSSVLLICSFFLLFPYLFHFQCIFLYLPLIFFPFFRISPTTNVPSPSSFTLFLPCLSSISYRTASSTELDVWPERASCRLRIK